MVLGAWQEPKEIEIARLAKQRGRVCTRRCTENEGSLDCKHSPRCVLTSHSQGFGTGQAWVVYVVGSVPAMFPGNHRYWNSRG